MRRKIREIRPKKKKVPSVKLKSLLNNFHALLASHVICKYQILLDFLLRSGEKMKLNANKVKVPRLTHENQDKKAQTLITNARAQSTSSKSECSPPYQ